MQRSKVFALTVLLSACAPLSPSIPKVKPCDAPAKADSVEVGDSPSVVDAKMNLSHTTSTDSDNNEVWTYCGNVVITIRAGGVIAVTK